MKLIFDPIFKIQLAEVYKHGKKTFGQIVADAYKLKIKNTIKLLKQNPEMGQEEYTLCNRNNTYRYLLILPYKIIYSIKDDSIRIHFMWHTSQSPEKMASLVCDDSNPFDIE